jgi:hypothetical protein
MRFDTYKLALVKFAFKRFRVAKLGNTMCQKGSIMQSIRKKAQNSQKKLYQVESLGSKCKL